MGASVFSLGLKTSVAVYLVVIIEESKGKNLLKRRVNQRKAEQDGKSWFSNAAPEPLAMLECRHDCAQHICKAVSSILV